MFIWSAYNMLWWEWLGTLSWESSTNSRWVQNDPVLSLRKQRRGWIQLMSLKFVGVIVKVDAETKDVLVEDLGHPAHQSVIRVHYALIALHHQSKDQPRDERYMYICTVTPDSPRRGCWSEHDSWFPPWFSVARAEESVGFWEAGRREGCQPWPCTAQNHLYML